jgi:DNA-directed RNA polymerase sigma subunit (sigma70/sigma32)
MAQKMPNSRSAGATRKEISAETPELLAKYLAHIGQGELLTHQEEIELSNRAKAGDKKARQKPVARCAPALVAPARTGPIHR